MRLIKFLVLCLLFAGAAHAQGMRFTSQVTQTATVATTLNVVTVPAGATVAFCNAPANAVPCTNKAATYTDATLGTLCSTSTQIVLDGTNNCIANPDKFGNWGVWVAVGQYAYTISVGGANFGPYFVTIPGAAGAVPLPCNPTNPGLVPTPPNDPSKFLDGTCHFNPSPIGPTGPPGAGSNLGVHEIDCSQQAGADFGAKMNACNTAGLAVSGGAILSTLAFSSPQTTTTAITISGGNKVWCENLVITGTTTITLSGTASSWSGPEGKECVINKNGNVDQFTVTGTDNSISNVNLNGNHASFTGNGISASSSLHTLIRNSVITDESSSAILATTASVDIQYVKFFDTFNNGISCGGGGATLKISDSIFIRDNTTTSSTLLVNGANCTTVATKMVMVGNTTTAENVAVPLSAALITNIAALSITQSNLLAGSGYPAIVSTGGTELQVIGNYAITGGGANGDLIDSSGTGKVNISDNMGVSVVAGSNGIVVTTADQVPHIEANHINFIETGVTGKCGIKFTGNIIGGTIRANLITMSNGVGASGPNHGICVTPDGTNHMDDNKITENSIQGTSSVANDNGIIFDNTISEGGNFVSFNLFRNNDGVDINDVIDRISTTGANTFENNFALASSNLFGSGGSTSDAVIQTAQPMSFANLPNAGPGSTIYCADCRIGTPATGSGTGALVVWMGSSTVGQWAALGNGPICTNITPVTVSANTAGDQLLQACTIPVAKLNTTNTNLRIHLKGTYSTEAGNASTITIKGRFCTVSGCGSGTSLTILSITSSANPGTVTTNPFMLDSTWTTQTPGAASAYEISGELRIDLGAAATSAATTFLNNNTATVGTIDNTGPLFLQMTGAFSVAGGAAGNIIVSRQLIVELE